MLYFKCFGFFLKKCAHVHLFHQQKVKTLGVVNAFKPKNVSDA